jgi:hypothetical protein
VWFAGWGGEVGQLGFVGAEVLFHGYRSYVEISNFWIKFNNN